MTLLIRNDSSVPQVCRQAHSQYVLVGPGLLAVGAVDDRMLILVNIEELMTGPAMGLAEQTLQQDVSLLSSTGKGRTP